MSATKIGYDCCGDRYASDATCECKCGCGLCYCGSCYEAHCVKLVDGHADLRAHLAAAERAQVHAGQFTGEEIDKMLTRAEAAEKEVKRLRSALVALNERVALHIGLRSSGRDTWSMLSTGLKDARAALDLPPTS